MFFLSGGSISCLDEIISLSIIQEDIWGSWGWKLPYELLSDDPDPNITKSERCLDQDFDLWYQIQTSPEIKPIYTYGFGSGPSLIEMRYCYWLEMKALLILEITNTWQVCAQIKSSSSLNSFPIQNICHFILRYLHRIHIRGSELYLNLDVVGFCMKKMLHSLHFFMTP